MTGVFRQQLRSRQSTGITALTCKLDPILTLPPHGFDFGFVPPTNSKLFRLHVLTRCAVHWRLLGDSYVAPYPGHAASASQHHSQAPAIYCLTAPVVVLLCLPTPPYAFPSGLPQLHLHPPGSDPSLGARLPSPSVVLVGGHHGFQKHKACRCAGVRKV